MRLLSLRLILSLFVGVTTVSLLFAYYSVRSEENQLRSDLERRAELLSESLSANVEQALSKGSPRPLAHIVERFANREHLVGIAVYDSGGVRLAETPALASLLDDRPPVVAKAIVDNLADSEFARIGTASVFIRVIPLYDDRHIVGALAVVYDSGYIGSQTKQVWRQSFERSLVLVALMTLLTLFIVHASLRVPISRAAAWLRLLRTQRGQSRRSIPELDLFQPLAHELAKLAERLDVATAEAETEARLRQTADNVWTAHRLAVHVTRKLGKSQLFVISNREPYLHVRRGRSIEVTTPASGLVTALEPVLLACDGTWVAHGSADADRDTVDEQDRLRVPPDDPHYTLRRVWLTSDEENGYYYGFANEGLWPLCHIAHTRPLFRASDWEFYQSVNRKFAEAALQEMDDTEEPVVLVQDYHFALLPRMIKEQRPDAKVSIFWHIPWPNPEAFAICPWQQDLLDGVLGADLVGFHVQAHCNNFLQTVDRALESQIDWETHSVRRNDHVSVVRPYPISVDLADAPQTSAAAPRYDNVRAALLRELGVEAIFVGVGVDRVDYTKGILERFLAIEHLLEKYPVYQNQFVFLQIGAPSRTHIQRYQDLLDQVQAEADRINQSFQTGNWRPIVFLKRQHNHAEIQRFYRAADLCLVTSLHDGMNLVAKEFLAARNDDDGVLVLSCFTGAARELRDALIVNPYDINQTAEAIRFALEMDPAERQERMQEMRRLVREQNIYRWAGNLIGQLCEFRVTSPRVNNSHTGARAPAA
jgi:trehalose 6-phosphate synthase